MQKIILITGFAGKDETTFPNVCKIAGSQAVVYLNDKTTLEKVRDILGVNEDDDLEQMSEDVKGKAIYVLAEETLQTLTKNIDLAATDKVIRQDKNGEDLYLLAEPVRSLNVTAVGDDSPEGLAALLDDCQDSSALEEFTNRDALRKKALAAVASSSRFENRAKAAALIAEKKAAREAAKAKANVPAPNPVDALQPEDSLGD